MGKRKIQSFDNFDSLIDWAFVKEKKQQVKVKSEKEIHSEFYLLFTDVTALYTFLYMTLAPEEAFEFQKVQPILNKMKGENHENQFIFNQCLRKLSLDWNGQKPLSEEFRKIKSKITEQQNNIYILSSKIDQQEAKQLLKSGLSQRKIHLDYHTKDGQDQESIIPTIANVSDFITIISDQKSNRYLLSFMTHAPELKAEEKEWVISSSRQQRFEHKLPETTPKKKTNFLNPDERPLPTVEHKLAKSSIPSQKTRKWSEDRMPVTFTIPSVQTEYLMTRSTHPDQQPSRWLHSSHLERSRQQPRSLKNSYLYSSRPTPSGPRAIKNPDQKLLPPPTNKYIQNQRKVIQNRKFLVNKQQPRVRPWQNVSEDQKRVRREQKEIHPIESLKENMQEVGHKAVEIGKKAENKIEETFQQLNKDKMNWVSLAIAGSIVLAGVNILRA